MDIHNISMLDVSIDQMVITIIFTEIAIYKGDWKKSIHIRQSVNFLNYSVTVVLQSRHRSHNLLTIDFALGYERPCIGCFSQKCDSRHNASTPMWKMWAWNCWKLSENNRKKNKLYIIQVRKTLVELLAFTLFTYKLTRVFVTSIIILRNYWNWSVGEEKQ